MGCKKRRTSGQNVWFWMLGPLAILWKVASLKLMTHAPEIGSHLYMPPSWKNVGRGGEKTSLRSKCWRHTGTTWFLRDLNWSKNLCLLKEARFIFPRLIKGWKKQTLKRLCCQNVVFLDDVQQMKLCYLSCRHSSQTVRVKFPLSQKKAKSAKIEINAKSRWKAPKIGKNELLEGFLPGAT